MWTRLWNAEPTLVTLLGSAAFWPAVFELFAAFNHPFTDGQQHAVAVFGVLVAGLIIRSQVSSPATVANGTGSGTSAVSDATRAKLGLWLMVGALAGAGVSGCASLGTFDRQAESLVHASIVQSEQLHAAGTLNDQQFRSVSLELNKVSVAGLAFTKALHAGQAKPTDAASFVALLTSEAAILRGLGVGALNTILDKLATLIGKSQALIKTL